jgi:bifunctional non-homologous end joining protein LigD
MSARTASKPTAKRTSKTGAPTRARSKASASTARAAGTSTARTATTRTAGKATTRTATTRTAGKATTRTATARKATPQKATARTATARKATPQKATARKATARKATPQKATARKATARKAGKATPQKATARKATARKTTTSKARTVAPRQARRSADAPAEKLRVYRAKRDFSLTSEPAGAAARSPSGFGYIIQKHAARRLHYDFRLELDGVLLSWAVPKGPSLVPTERRLAVRTEDHPVEYADFEGVIPAGEYGGGTVMLWDQGTWTPEGDPREGLRKGRLTFDLHGARLTGRWHLVRTHSDRYGDTSENWLLFKGRDDQSREAGDAELVDTELTSVTTGRSMDEIAEDRDRTWRSNRTDDEPSAPRAAHAARPAAKPQPDSGPDATPTPSLADLTGLVGRLPTGIKFTNLDKVLFPEQGLTKAALIAYYAVVADWILPHIAGRPLTLVRCPNGPGEHCFFQKHTNNTTPSAIQPLPLVEEDGEEKSYMLIDDLDGLLAVVQLGSLELHTWGSHARTVEKPDILVFDLDPDEGLPWERVVEGAFAMRALLADIGLDSWCKTTGGKGLHVCVPVAPHLEWEEAKAFTKAVSEMLQGWGPSRFTTNMSKAKRKDKIFVDYLRNGRGATFIAPYSTRRHARAPVATPVTWDELYAGIDPKAFTVQTVPARLDGLSEDPWADLRTSRQSITAAMRRRVLGS